ncbi:uncharacterized protein LOC112088842 [Eutrema salsugineum]|uniref:uncharacterized protein LOC112088842 n=1 Tax=Eutrema salsugineum TaxID=72664 RepID=UPI000CED10C5|nr:uncharacterized protein LOC112088842 [Eutrema salsugineum]
MCVLFPFSLTGRASKWLKTLPPASLKTWKECREAFLSHFYTRDRSNLLRDKIQKFQQKDTEDLYDAWERFRDYQRDCPHHGFSEERLMTIFYHGFNEELKFSLDASSNGDFSTRTIREGIQKILSVIDHIHNSDEGNNHSKPYIEKMNNLEVERNFQNQEMMQIADVYQIEEAEQNQPHQGWEPFNRGKTDLHRGWEAFDRGQEEFHRGSEHFTRGKPSLQPPFQTFFEQTHSDQSNPTIPPYYPFSKIEELEKEVNRLKEEMESQSKRHEDSINKLSTLFLLQISDESKELDSSVNDLDEPFSERINEWETSDHLKAITLRSGLAYKEPEYPKYFEEGDAVVGKEGEKEKKDTSQEIAEEEPMPPPLTRVYKPKPPYPRALKGPKKEKERAKLKEIVEQLNVRLPFIEACAMIPALRKYMKGILTNSIALEEGVMMITHECSSILQNHIP